MRFTDPLLPAVLLRRYKRFLADVRWPDGREETVHCPNTGALLGCATPGSRIWLSRALNLKRKYPYTWELVEVEDGVIVGINTGRPNALVAEAIAAGLLGELSHFELRREVRYGSAGSRVDFLLERNSQQVYLEVKNVNAAVSDGIALFPDAVSSRASRHLQELMAMVAAGHRALLVFCVQRGDVHTVHPADTIDPLYGETLREALANGVEALALGATPTPAGIQLDRQVAVVCPPRDPPSAG